MDMLLYLENMNDQKEIIRDYKVGYFKIYFIFL